MMIEEDEQGKEKKEKKEKKGEEREREEGEGCNRYCSYLVEELVIVI